jgi:hypothetical protein
LKIAKGYPEEVRRKRKDSEMIKRKSTNNDITQQTKEQAKGPYKLGQHEIVLDTSIRSTST